MLLIKNEFFKTLEYIKKHIAFLAVIMFILFILSAVTAYFIVGTVGKSWSSDVFKSIVEMFDAKDLEDSAGGLSAVKLFFNNTRAAILSIAYGFIPFLFLPLWADIINGAVVGFILGVMNQYYEGSILMVITKYLLPHGIFEIPAICLSYALGINMCLFLIKKIFKKTGNVTFKEHLKGTLGVIVFFIVPFLVIAAFIEGVVL